MIIFNKQNESSTQVRKIYLKFSFYLPPVDDQKWPKHVAVNKNSIFMHFMCLCSEL